MRHLNLRIFKRPAWISTKIESKQVQTKPEFLEMSSSLQARNAVTLLKKQLDDATVRSSSG